MRIAPLFLSAMTCPAADRSSIRSNGVTGERTSPYFMPRRISNRSCVVRPCLEHARRRKVSITHPSHSPVKKQKHVCIHGERGGPRAQGQRLPTQPVKITQWSATKTQKGLSWGENLTPPVGQTSTLAPDIDSLTVNAISVMSVFLHPPRDNRRPQFMQALNITVLHNVSI